MVFRNSLTGTEERYPNKNKKRQLHGEVDVFFFFSVIITPQWPQASC